MTLRKLLLSSGPIAVGHLQLGLQWQYDLLRSSRGSQTPAHSATSRADRNVQHLFSESILAKCEPRKEVACISEISPLAVSPGIMLAKVNPSLLGSAGTKEGSVSDLEGHGEQSCLEDPDQSVGKILSSTFVSVPSLLWDSFDLRQHQDSVDG